MTLLPTLFGPSTPNTNHVQKVACMTVETAMYMLDKLLIQPILQEPAESVGLLTDSVTNAYRPMDLIYMNVIYILEKAED